MARDAFSLVAIAIAIVSAALCIITSLPLDTAGGAQSSHSMDYPRRSNSSSQQWSIAHGSAATLGQDDRRGETPSTADGPASSSGRSSSGGGGNSMGSWVNDEGIRRCARLARDKRRDRFFGGEGHGDTSQQAHHQLQQEGDDGVVGQRWQEAEESGDERDDAIDWQLFTDEDNDQPWRLAEAPDPRTLQLLARCPGYDGAVVTRRFEKVSYSPVPETDPNYHAIKALVLDTCVKALAQRDASPSATNQTVDRMLLTVKQLMSRPDASPLHQHAAKYIPATLYQAMRIMEEDRVCVWPKLLSYDMCPCGFLYRCDDKDAATCPGHIRDDGFGSVCDRPRSEARNLTYSPIRHFMERLYADRQRAAELAEWQQRRCRRSDTAEATAGTAGDDQQGQLRDPDLLLDISDGDMVEAILQGDPLYLEDPRHLVCVLVTDPFIVPADERERSTTPYLLLVVNAPMEKRHILGYCTLVALVSGNVKPPGAKSQPVPMHHNHTLGVLVDELAVLGTIGHWVTDARTGTPFLCRLKVAAIISDYPGLKAHIGLKGPPSQQPCFKCTHSGCRLGQKCVYPGHYPLLPLPHPLRPVMCKMHRAGVSDVVNATVKEALTSQRETASALRGGRGRGRGGAGGRGRGRGRVEGIDFEMALDAVRGAVDQLPDNLVDAAPPPARSREQLMFALPPTSTTPVLRPGDPPPRWRRAHDEPDGVACPLYELPYFCPVRGVNYDAMHTIGGVIKDTVVFYLQGLRETSVHTQLYDAIHAIQPITNEHSAGLAAFRAALQSIAKDAPRSVAGRLSRLTTAGKKAKTHTYFLLGGPYGAYAIACAMEVEGGIPRPVGEALIDLLGACSSLWDKVQRRSGLEELRVRVVRAVCAIERHASAHEMDVKVHNLVHLVDGIRNMGPLYLHAMFNSESMWGKLGQWAHNKTHMEASMFNCALDKDVTYSIRQALAKGEEDDNLRGAGAPDNIDGVGTAEGEGTASPWDEAGFFKQDPEVFIGRPGEERQLTEDERRDIGKLYRRSGDGLLKQAGSPRAVASLSVIWVDKVKIQVDSWFLCRPDETGQLWFGEVQSLALDSRSVMADREAVLVQAKWYKAEAQVDKRLQCPVTSVMPTRSSAGAWYLADSIIPWVVVCAVHPLDDGKRVMLSRHWHILRSIRLLT